jgi:4'-phosphopantetheinyl transferase
LATLGPEERQRSEQLLRGRDWFVARRGILRALIGAYLDVPPARLVFGVLAEGKPVLAGEFAGALSFSVSHSDGLALFAMSRSAAVGIDVERIRPDVAEEPIAERFFAPSETEAIRGLPKAEQADAFFDCWTQKEAVLKAKGCGLTVPLRQWAVSVRADRPPGLLPTSGALGEAERWRLFRLRPGPGYAGALAVDGGGCRLTCWDWTEG